MAVEYNNNGIWYARFRYRCKEYQRSTRIKVPSKGTVAILSVLAVCMMCLTGCASIAWRDAHTTDSIFSYERYIRQYPNSRHAPDAQRRLETLRFNNATDRGTTQALESFLQHYPSGTYTVQVRQKLELLRQELSMIEDAVRSVLPDGTRVDVATAPHQHRGRIQFVIAAHLLEGHSADDASSRVRGNYGNQAALTRLVQQRSASIVKSVSQNALPSHESFIVVRAMHGVRHTHQGQPWSGRDVATCLYEVAIPVSTIRSRNVQEMNADEIMRLWEVRVNIISNLTFRTEFGGRGR